MANNVPRVPIPRNGVDYRGKIVLAPMVRSGELPSRLLALKYGADLVWGPETVDRALIGSESRPNKRASTVEITRIPSNIRKNPELATRAPESVIYRIHPSRESSRLIFQLGTASPELAVQGAQVVAPHVAGIDVNAGCPKPFSTSGGMGAALLSTPDLLCSILRALVTEIGQKYEIGISVKIRLLKTEEETKSLVQQLCQTGITGLTIHCRTRQMRKTERAIRDQLRMVADTCRATGVACLMNGDVDSREHAEGLVEEFGVDGAMIASAAEKNLSVFRRREEGGAASWEEVVRGYMEEAIAVENRYGNTKFLLAQLMPGKQQGAKGLSQAKNYSDICARLGLDDLQTKAHGLDERLGLLQRETKSQAKASARSEAVEQKRASKASPHAGALTKKRRLDAEEPTSTGKTDFLTDLQADIVAPAGEV
ncbi:MAG: hypothetical protein Q9159_000069 [Coniocarpon cinnabarinum]